MAQPRPTSHPAAWRLECGRWQRSWVPRELPRCGSPGRGLPGRVPRTRWTSCRFPGWIPPTWHAAWKLSRCVPRSGGATPGAVVRSARRPGHQFASARPARKPELGLPRIGLTSLALPRRLGRGGGLARVFGLEWGVPRPRPAFIPTAVARRPSPMGLAGRTVGLGPSAAAPTELGPSHVGWLFPTPGTMATACWLGCADLELLGILSGAGVGALLPAVGLLALRGLGSVSGPVTRPR